MIRLYLLIFIIFALIYGKPLLKKAPAFLKKYTKRLILITILITLLLLIITGHLNAVIALIGVFIVSVLRLIPTLLYYAPRLHNLWQGFNKANTRSSSANEQNMSKAEAYQVLGLQPNASKQAIIEAHRKLMQKNHPDRGGSDYLASKINLAKKILLPK